MLGSDFAPSAASARVADPTLKIVTRKHPSGAEGAFMSLKEVAHRILEGRLDPRVRAWAIAQLHKAGRPKSHLDKAQAVLDGLRKKALYVPDSVNAEFIQAAHLTLCLDEGSTLCFAGGDCFPEGTLVLRDNFDFVPIEEIKVGDRIWGRDKWTRVEGKAFKGHLAVDAIEMNNGSTLNLTAGHKVYVGRCVHGRGGSCPTCRGADRCASFERVSVSDLGEEDALLQPDRIAFGKHTPDPDCMYVEGMALADGWVQESRFRIGGLDGKRKEAQKHEVKAICERLGIPTHWHTKYIEVQDAAWAQRIAGLGSRARFKHLETIDLAEASAEAALRGIMADSAANTHGPGRTYSTTSRQLMMQCRVLHRMFGRSTSVRMLTSEQHGGAGKHPLWRVGVRQTSGQVEKTLLVKSIERAVREVPCWDIQTEDHYVYLPEHDVTVSNCDDLCVAFGSAVMSIGIPVQVVGQVFDGSSTPTHVICAIQTEDGRWLKADPSSERWPVGQCSPATGETYIDPFDEDDKTSGLAGGATTGDYVGVGASPAFAPRFERHWYPVGVGGWAYVDRPAAPPVGVGQQPGWFHAAATNAATWVDYGAVGAAIGVAAYVVSQLVKR